ncbi:hypothetical protein IAT38_005063 [Cryptococcus sp. DSM 104549]
MMEGVYLQAWSSADEQYLDDICNEVSGCTRVVDETLEVLSDWERQRHVPASWLPPRDGASYDLSDPQASHHATLEMDLNIKMGKMNPLFIFAAKRLLQRHEEGHDPKLWGIWESLQPHLPGFVPYILPANGPLKASEIAMKRRVVVDVPVATVSIDKKPLQPHGRPIWSSALPLEELLKFRPKTTITSSNNNASERARLVPEAVLIRDDGSSDVESEELAVGPLPYPANSSSR